MALDFTKIAGFNDDKMSKIFAAATNPDEIDFDPQDLITELAAKFSLDEETAASIVHSFFMGGEGEEGEEGFGFPWGEGEGGFPFGFGGFGEGEGGFDFGM